MKKLLLGIGLLMLLLSLATGQTTLYTETFANGTLQNPWYAGFSGNSNNMEAVAYPGNPSGDGWVGRLGNDISRSASSALSGDPAWSDFYFEAMVFLRPDSAFYYGIEFRVDSSNVSRGYNFVAQLNPSFGPTRLRFRKRDVTTPTVIRDWNSAQVPGGLPTQPGWHKMAVEVVGNQFRLFFDDNELPGGPYTDDTYSTGFIGTYLFGTDTLTTYYLHIDDITVTSVSAIGDGVNPELVSDFILYQNYPNPFNPSTTIAFYLPAAEVVNLAVFNSLGQKVRDLAAQRFAPGVQQVQWDGEDNLGRDVPAGVYFYRISAGEFQSAKKMLLVR